MEWTECGTRTFPDRNRSGTDALPDPTQSGYGHIVSYGVRHLATQINPDAKMYKV